MQSKANSVDEYLQEVPDDRKSALERLRSLCQEHLSAFEEGMTYGVPGYSRNGEVEVGFASQKHNIALYILRKDILDEHRAAFPPSAIGKGCIRYRNVAKIDYALVNEMLRKIAASIGPVC